MRDTSNKRAKMMYSIPRSCGILDVAIRDAKSAIGRCLDKVKELEYIDLLFTRPCGPEEDYKHGRRTEAVNTGR